MQYLENDIRPQDRSESRRIKKKSARYCISQGATLKTSEDAHAAETSQLETRVNDLERDLGKSASALFKMKKERRAKASEVRRLQREIHNQEEPRTRESAGTVVPRDEFCARLMRMALFDSLMTVRKKDLALAGVEGKFERDPAAQRRSGSDFGLCRG
ncbi:hypothetical protein Bca4012_010512 [Brassica carinata]